MCVRVKFVRFECIRVEYAFGRSVHQVRSVLS